MGRVIQDDKTDTVYVPHTHTHSSSALYSGADTLRYDHTLSTQTHAQTHTHTLEVGYPTPRPGRVPPNI